MKKWVSGILMLGLVSLMGCKKDSLTSIKEVQIGALLSLTGNWSSLGLTSQEAIQMAILDVNDYMEWTNSNLRFTSVVYDTKLDTSLAKQAMDAVDLKKMKYVIGPQSSAELAAIKSISDKKNILVVSQGSTASSLAILNDGIFRFCPGDVVEGGALANTMYSEGIKVVVSLSRNDEGNKGLQTSIGKAFTSLGGQVDAIVPYATTLTDYSALLASLKTKLQSYIALQGANKVAVYLASFDECVALFKQASTDPIFSSVKWYGGDGVVLSSALTSDIQAAAFASTTKFIAPNFGLPSLPHPDLAAISSAIKSKTGIEPDAYALAAYDAVWVIAKTVSALSNSATDFSVVKNVFNMESSKYFGITGPLMLNAAGDRSTGSFDYWGIVLEGGSYKWKLVGKSL